MAEKHTSTKHDEPAEKHTGTKHDEPMAPKQGEPVAPTRREIDREMDPTKRRRDMPNGDRGPDTGGDPLRAPTR